MSALIASRMIRWSIGLALALPAGAAHGAVTVVDVGPGNTWYGVNDSGQLAGAVPHGSEYQAARWEDGVATALGTDGTTGRVITKDGTVLGVITVPNVGAYPAWWDPAQHSAQSASLAGGEDGGFVDISPNGTTAVNATPVQNSQDGHYYGGVVVRPPFRNVQTSAPSIRDATGVDSVNDAGHALTSQVNSPYGPLFWDGTTAYPVGVVRTGPHELNNSDTFVGHILGSFQAAEQTGPHGAVVDLPDLPGAAAGDAQPTVINNQGIVAGTSSKGAVIWQPGGSSVALLDSLLPPGSPWHLKTVTDMSDNGYILGTGTINGGPLHTYLIVGRAVAKISLAGLTRLPAIGPLPSPLSPSKVAFGDEVRFGLTGWKPRGGPISVSWAGKRLGEFKPDASGSSEGEFKIEDFPNRGTDADFKPCEGALVARQGGTERELVLKSPAEGAVLVNDQTKIPLKAGDSYCEGERILRRFRSASSGGALIYSERGENAEEQTDAGGPANWIAFPLTIIDDERNIDVTGALAHFRRQVCVRLSGKRWAHFTVPHRGHIDTAITNHTCRPINPSVDPNFGNLDPSDVQGVSTITTSTSRGSDWSGIWHFTDHTTFLDRVLCDNSPSKASSRNLITSYMFGDKSLTFSKGLVGQCFVAARGDIVIRGATTVIVDAGFTLDSDHNLVLYGSKHVS